MRLNFVKMNPGGNTTVFISDPVPRDFHAKVADIIMKPASVGAEQVGFIEKPISGAAVARLQMAGNEFCGNATRAFAAWLVQSGFPGIVFDGNKQGVIVPVEVSGCNEVLEPFVHLDEPDTDSKEVQVELSMPLPQKMEDQTGPEGEPYTLVIFEGIIHAVLWNVAPSEEHFQKIKEEIQARIPGFECLGVMYYDEKGQYLTPLVYVEQVNSLVWESCCGSGSVALASALAREKQQSIKAFCLHQPGGELEVSVGWDGGIKHAAIKGGVSLSAQGQVYL